jgi:hypothetical protein
VSLYVTIYFYSTRFADRPVATLFLYRNMLRKSWDSSFSIVSRLRAGRSGVQIPAMTKLFLFSKCPYPLWGPSSLLFKGCRGFRRGKLGANHFPPHAVEVKNEWSSTPPLTFAPSTGTTLRYILVFEDISSNNKSVFGTIRSIYVYLSCVCEFFMSLKLQNIGAPNTHARDILIDCCKLCKTSHPVI